MNTEIEISGYISADDTDLRSLEFNINSQRVMTPIKTITTREFFKETVFPKHLINLNEIFFRFDEKSLKEMNEDRSYSAEKNNEVARSKRKSNNCPQLCIAEFKNSDLFPRYPTELEIEILSNTAYSFSDITPIPCIPKVARNISTENFDDFLKYLQACYEKIQIANKKKILGYIPSLAPLFIRRIVDFYLDTETGINAFYIDFDGTMINSNLDKITALKKRLAERGYEENNFLHYINVDYGKAINDQKTVSARDLLAFGYGLDSLGGNHSGKKRGKEFYEWLQKNKAILTNSNRLLNIEDYGYYKLDSLGSAINEIFPSDAIAPISEAESAIESRSRRTIKIVNLQQQCKETVRLKQLTAESQENTLNYFKSKRNVMEGDIKLLRKR